MIRWCKERENNIFLLAQRLDECGIPAVRRVNPYNNGIVPGQLRKYLLLGCHSCFVIYQKTGNRGVLFYHLLKRGFAVLADGEYGDFSFGQLFERKYLSLVFEQRYGTLVKPAVQVFGIGQYAADL